MEWYLTVIKNYTGFTGRAHRQEYWMFILVNAIVCIVLNIIQMIIGLELPYLTMLYSLALLLPNIAVCMRRLHDIDRTGWWLLMMLLPIIGWIVLLVFYCQPGTAGANRFGEDPKAAVTK